MVRMKVRGGSLEEVELEKPGQWDEGEAGPDEDSGDPAEAFVNGGVKPGHCGGARVGQFGSVSLLGEGARRHGARAHHGAGACHGAWPSGQGS